jgi:glutamate/aspartate transport system permease protein
MIALVESFRTVLVALIEYNMRMTASAIALALPVSCLFAVWRLSSFPLIYYPVAAYVNVLRSSPLIMILFWAYYTGPMLTGRPTSAYTAALVALAAFEVAYFTEVVRTGIQSISVGQRHAGLASGLTPAQVTAFIVLPQALYRMAPSLLTQSIIAFQDSTIASVIGVSEALQSATIINAREQRPIELYTGLAVVYFLVCYGLSRWVRRLEARVSRRIAGGLV